MNKTDEILERLKGWQPVIDNPEKLTESIMNSLPDRGTPQATFHYAKASWWCLAAAASIVIALLFWPKEHEAPTIPPEPQPVIAEQAKPQPPKPIERASPIPSEGRVKHSREGVNEADAPPSPLERAGERLEEPPVVPPDHQALVNIYLAEETLQVAYNQQAQAEALQTFIAILEGEVPTPAKTIIAF